LDSNEIKFDNLSVSCWWRLSELAHTSHKIDIAILEEIKVDRQTYSPLSRRSTRFPETDKNVQSFTEAVEGFGKLSYPSVLHSLEWIDFIHLWSTLDSSSKSTNWAIAKQKARVILKLRADCMSLVDFIKKDLTELRDYHGLLLAIRARLGALDGFEIIYDRQPEGRFEPLWEEPSRETNVSVAYSHNQQNVLVPLPCLGDHNELTTTAA
jgi:hypothetical protein